MSTELVLAAEARTGTGKAEAKKLRSSGRVPGVLLAKGKSHHISVDLRDFTKVARGGKEMKLSFGGETKSVLIHELQIGPVSRRPVHVDFLVK